ncbi:GNAT family N-acetyltransferase [Gorillibacterium sp. sgz500922]|uniref:GNAT family N-acetyltransferase n=1 Tax=Gorillibacterium sp. sgz500922 TaxID=3446694 RepID=UPI003F662F32
MLSFHALEGDRIRLRPLAVEDAPAVHDYASDEQVSRFIGWRLMSRPEETAAFVDTMLQREAAGTHRYASIVEKSTQTVIGTAMLFNFDQEANRAELGYVLHRGYWGKGYGTECVALATGFAFDVLKLHKLQASVVDANVGSARVLEKNGYRLEGRLTDHYYLEGRYLDALLFGRIQDQG